MGVEESGGTVVPSPANWGGEAYATKTLPDPFWNRGSESRAAARDFIASEQPRHNFLSHVCELVHLRF